MGLFHIETLRADNTWGTFTEEPFEDKGEAEKHMAYILANIPLLTGGPPPDPTRVRVHELTDREEILHHVRKLTPEELDDLIVKYIESLPPGEFVNNLREAKKRNEQADEAHRQFLKEFGTAFSEGRAEP